ncbi:hypothetical protein DB346_21945 [Verrucomicrobia bacterium LW23]|nr:hypothetical protein DB346_21945 [Verrucomicrobia bacterium LW23]
MLLGGAVLLTATVGAGIVWYLLATSVCFTSKWPHMAWSPDGTRLAIGSDDGSVTVLEWKDGSEFRTQRRYVPPPEIAFTSDHPMAWSPDGATIAICHSPAKILMLKLGPDGAGTFSVPPQIFAHLAHQTIASGQSVGVAHYRFAPADPELRERFMVPVEPVPVWDDYWPPDPFAQAYAAAWSSTGRLAIATDGQIAICDAATGKIARMSVQLNSFWGMRGARPTFRWDPAGQRVLVTSDGYTSVIDADSGIVLYKSLNPRKAVHGVPSDFGNDFWQWAPDGSLVRAMKSIDESKPELTLQRLPLPAGSEKETISVLSSLNAKYRNAGPLSVSTDGRHIATGIMSTRVTAWALSQKYPAVATATPVATRHIHPEIDWDSPLPLGGIYPTCGHILPDPTGTKLAVPFWIMQESPTSRRSSLEYGFVRVIRIR